MLKKYVSKFAMDILPSVVATIIGAYIVNHYIVTKPGADAPVAAAVSAADPKKADIKSAAKPAEVSPDVASIPAPGVRAKGISEKAILERAAVEKPVEKPLEKSVEKPADKPAETASLPTASLPTASPPADTRRHQIAPREKTAAKPVPAPVQPSAPAVAPVVSAPNPAPPVEPAAAPTVEERRDANDLARAAIERLRGTSDASPRAQEAARADPPRVPDASRVVSAPQVTAPQLRPLPPPIMVSTPPGRETFDSATGSVPMKPPYAATARIDDPLRPTPPAEIPFSSGSQPLDLHAEAAGPSAHVHTTVAEDVLSAAKSVFHAVLPK
jgi:hypothetical protein